MTGATIRLRAEERWQGTGLVTRRLPATMGLVALASLAAHLAIVVGAAFDARLPPSPPQEITVEIVQDVPKPAETAKPEVPKPEAAKLEAAKPKAPEAAKLEAPKPEAAKLEPPKASTVARQVPKPAAGEAAKDQKLAALQQELAALKAEQAQLQSERTADATDAQPAAQMRDTGLGPLPDSFQAVALPASADGQGEATSYQEIVFSALAKAKGIGATKGLPGTAGVHFSIDASGRLVGVELVHGSGVAALDAEALDIVHRASPFPAPPQGAQRAFDANFTFKTQAAP